MKISRVFVAIAGAALIATNAIAADLPPAPTVVGTPSPPPSAAPVFGWGGPYAGLFVLGGTLDLTSYVSSYTGVQGGVLIGNLWQLRERLILGVEADAGVGPIGYAPHNACTDPSQTCVGGEFPRYLGPSGHLRAIVGVSRDNAMVFAAGGLVVTQGVVGASTTATGGGEAAYDEELVKSWLPGLSIGFGAEWRIGDSNRVRLETIYDRYFGGFAYSASSSVTITCCSSSASTSGFFSPGSVYAVRLGFIHAF